MLPLEKLLLHFVSMGLYLLQEEDLIVLLVNLVILFGYGQRSLVACELHLVYCGLKVGDLLLHLLFVIDECLPLCVLLLELFLVPLGLRLSFGLHLDPVGPCLVCLLPQLEVVLLDTFQILDEHCELLDLPVFVQGDLLKIGELVALLYDLVLLLENHGIHILILFNYEALKLLVLLLLGFQSLCLLFHHGMQVSAGLLQRNDSFSQGGNFLLKILCSFQFLLLCSNDSFEMINFNGLRLHSRVSAVGSRLIQQCSGLIEAFGSA